MGQDGAVAFCPCPPLLVPELAAGAAAELDALRVACDRAVATLLDAGPNRIAVLAGGDDHQWSGTAGGSLRSHGVEVHAGGPGEELPTALTIGAWLLDRAGWSGPRRYATVREDTPHADVREAWLVMGDGCAKRTATSPGGFDPRARPFDTVVANALATGDAAGLGELDLAAGEQLWCAGAPVWRGVGRALTGRVQEAALLADEAPYGVGYLVATWSVTPRR